MDDAVSHGVDTNVIPKHGLLKPLERDLYGRSNTVQRSHLMELVSRLGAEVDLGRRPDRIGGAGSNAARLIDACALVRAYQAELERRAATVDRENVHAGARPNGAPD